MFSDDKKLEIAPEMVKNTLKENQGKQLNLSDAYLYDVLGENVYRQKVTGLI